MLEGLILVVGGLGDVLLRLGFFLLRMQAGLGHVALLLCHHHLLLVQTNFRSFVTFPDILAAVTDLSLLLLLFG